MPLSPNFGGQVAGSSKNGGGGSSAQLFPARVKEIVLQPSTDPNSLFALNSGYTSIAYISFHPLKSVVDSPNKANLIAAPLDVNIRRLPLLNEVVLILSTTDVMNQDQLAQKYYYISGVSIWNSVHHNGFPDLSYLGATQKSTNQVGYQSTQDGIVKKPNDPPKDLYLGDTFIENPQIRNLFPVEGDVILEGRFGNSMRLSHTSRFPSQSVTSPWSNYGSNTKPITIIRNGQTKEVPAVKWTPIFESIDGDASSIYLTNGQEIQMTLASRNLASYGTIISSSADVVQVPNVLMQPTNVPLIDSDNNELQVAVSQSTSPQPLNTNVKTIVSSSVSASAQTVNNSSITNTSPTASVDGSVEKKITSGAGSSKYQAIPESKIGPLTWLGEEILPLSYTQQYQDEDETQYWLPPEPIAIPDAVTRILQPPPPPTPPTNPTGNGPSGGPTTNPPTSTPTPAQIEAAKKAAAAGLDLLPDIYEGNKGALFQLAYIAPNRAASIETITAFIVMSAGAKLEKVTLSVYSAFRPPYKSFTAKSAKGNIVTGTGQATLRGPKGYVCGKWTEEKRYSAPSTCWDPYTAKPGSSRHGSGQALDIETTSPGSKAQRPPDTILTPAFTWLALNSWKYGFVRAVTTEVWHWEYWGDVAKKGGPYVQFDGKPDSNFKRTLSLNGKSYDLSNIKV